MYERRHEMLLPRPLFYRRLARQVGLAAGVLLASLLAGMAGYRHFESLSWIDAFANASMILSGMGPLGELKTSGGKIFAGLYALFSGVIFLTAFSLVLAPILHRAMHHFHRDPDEGKREHN
jgi:hypothetical protein